MPLPPALQFYISPAEEFLGSEKLDNLMGRVTIAAASHLVAPLAAPISISISILHPRPHLAAVGFRVSGADFIMTALRFGFSQWNSSTHHHSDPFKSAAPRRQVTKSPRKTPLPATRLVFRCPIWFRFWLFVFFFLLFRHILRFSGRTLSDVIAAACGMGQLQLQLQLPQEK